VSCCDIDYAALSTVPLQPFSRAISDKIHFHWQILADSSRSLAKAYVTKNEFWLHFAHK
jgi:hypothetical protein